MNWTGGRLSRHSGTSNPVKDRQKQRFAKVQQALRSGPKKHSPIKWTFFDHIAENLEPTQRKSFASKHTTPQAADYPHSQPSLQKHGHLLSSRNVAQQNGSRHSSRSQELLHPRPILVPVKQQPSRVPDDDLYNTTPPPREAKRKREDSMAISEMENLADQEEEESLSEKRRKILRQGDWVGIGIQRPLQLTFASPRKEENIGKRRRITDGHRAQYSSKQLHIISPFPTKRRLLAKQLLANQSSSQEGPQNREPPRTDVRISIGGRVVPPGVSSSSAPRRMGSHSTTAHRRSQTTSSDVMLLDANASSTEVSPRMATSNVAAIRYPMPVHQLDNQDRSPTDASLEHGVAQGDHIPYEAKAMETGWAGCPSETGSELQEKDEETVSHQDNFESKHNTRRTHVPRNCDTHPRRLIFLSSTASIHHPAPRSSRLSVLLRSASSEIAESTMAHVGKDRPVVPSSQVLENEIWETWIAPEQNYDHSSDHLDVNEVGTLQRVSISPGVSTRHALWHASSVEDDIEDERLFELQGANLGEPATDSELSNVQVSSAQSTPEPTQIETEKIDDKAEENRHSFSPPQQELPKTVSPVLPNNPVMDEDQNLFWTKFLFGGIGDELDATIPTPAREVVPSQKREFLGTSILGQASGGGSAVSDPNPSVQDTDAAAAPSSTSGGASRITEESPCLTSSRYREVQVEMASPVDSPSWTGEISVQGRTDSTFALSSDSVSASVAVQTTSQYSAFNLVEAANLYRQQRKVTFTRPKPFIGRKANLDATDQRDSLYIGRNLIEDDENFESRRKRKRNVRHFVESNEPDEQEDVECIEDD